MMKICSKCKVLLTSEKFYKEKTKTGLSSQCKNCRRERDNTRKSYLGTCYRTMKHAVNRNKNSLQDKYKLNLTKEKFLSLIEEHIKKNGFVCEVTNVPLTTQTTGDRKKYNVSNFSVDRLDPSIGYNEENIIFVSWEFNKRKKDINLRDCFAILKLYKKRYPQKYENVKQEFKELFI